MHGRALAAILAASMGWGMAGVGVRALFIDGVSTFTVVVGRVVLATLALVAYFVARRQDLSGQVWRRGGAIGVLRIGLAPTFFIASLQFISAGFEALVITLVPVTTAVLAHFWIGERITPRQLVGLVLGLAGTAVLILSGDSGIAEGGNTLIGGGLALAGVLCGSASGVIARQHAPFHRTVDLAVPMFVAGSLVVVLIGGVVGGIDTAPLDSFGWVLLVALALGSTLLPFVTTLYASAHASATRVALTGYLAPIIGLVGGVVLLDEVVTPAIAAGGALTIVGVVVVGLARQPAPAAA